MYTRRDEGIYRAATSAGVCTPALWGRAASTDAAAATERERAYTQLLLSVNIYIYPSRYELRREGRPRAKGRTRMCVNGLRRARVTKIMKSTKYTPPVRCL